MKEKYWDIVGEHFGNAEIVLEVLCWIWGIGATISVVALSIQGALNANEAMDIWPFFQILGSILAGIITAIFFGFLAGVSTVPLAIVTLAITGVVCLFTALYAYTHQAEEAPPVLNDPAPIPDFKPDPTPPPPPPKPKPTPPPPKPKPMPQPPQFTVSPPPKPSKTQIKPAYARQQWEQLISKLQAVGREIDQVASSSALRNEFEVLRVAVLHEGGIKLANEQWEDLEVIVNLTQTEITSLSPVDRSLGVLGISRDRLTIDHLKQRHRKLAKTHHPDTGPTAVPDRMASINASYQILKKYLST